MRNVRLTLWHMLLIVLLALSVIVNGLSAVRVLLPAWQTPWLLPLLALAALDSVVTQRVIVQERLELGEQLAVRGVEWALLVVVARGASALGEGVPLPQLVQPWLRDPLAFFGGRLWEYLLAVFGVWLLTTLITQAVLNLEAEVPPSNVRAGAIDEAVLLQDRAVALARFDRLWLFCVLLALAGAAFLLVGVSLGAALGSWATTRPLLAAFGAFVAGFLLHSQGQFDQLRFGWQLEQISIQADVARRWQRASWLLLCGALLVGLLLASGLRFIPPPPLVPLINALLVAMTFMLALILVIFSVLLLPFAWLLSLLTGGEAPPAPQLPQFMPPQIPQPPGARPLLPALIFWLCIILLMGMAALRYARQRQAIRAVLGRWRGLRWLLNLLGSAWLDVQGWGAHAARVVRQRLMRRRRKLPRRLPPRGAAARLRAVYQQMVRAAAERGVDHPRAQTPYEFRTALGAALPPAEADVAGLTDVYVQAEYGPQPVKPTDVRHARRHWRQIERVFARARRAGSRQHKP